MVVINNKTFSRTELRNFYHILVGTDLRRDLRNTAQNIGLQQVLKNAAPARMEMRPTITNINPNILEEIR